MGLFSFLRLICDASFQARDVECGANKSGSKCDSFGKEADAATNRLKRLKLSEHFQSNMDGVVGFFDNDFVLMLIQNAHSQIHLWSKSKDVEQNGN